MTESSDRALLDFIRRRGPLTVADMVTELRVTPTAVRNRLSRLVGTGLVERKTERATRGRPKHTYQASHEAHKSLGQNYADLALALWDEMMGSVAVADRKLRRLLFTRVTERLAEHYRAQMTGDELQGRLVQLSAILHTRGIEAEVSLGGEVPVLRQHSCPYYELAEDDPTICALERKMLEKVIGRGLRLSHCRLDGHRSCDFEPKPLIKPRPEHASA